MTNAPSKREVFQKGAKAGHNAHNVTADMLEVDAGKSRGRERAEFRAEWDEYSDLDGVYLDSLFSYVYDA